MAEDGREHWLRTSDELRSAADNEGDPRLRLRLRRAATGLRRLAAELASGAANERRGD